MCIRDRIGATVKIVNSDKGTATDIDGFFSIPNIEVGIYDIEISYVSFKTELLKNIKIEAVSYTHLDVYKRQANIPSGG